MIGMVLVITAILFMVVYFCYSYFLLRDFEVTTEKLHSQFAQNVDARIRQMDNAINTYMTKTDVLSKLNGASIGNYNDIHSITNYHHGFLMVFFNMDDGWEYYSMAEGKRLFSNFIEEYNIKERINGSDGCWTFVKDIYLKTEDYQFYLYTKPIIFDGDALCSGYITVVMNSTIEELFEKEQNKLCYNDVYYLYSDGYIAAIYNDADKEPLPEKVIYEAVNSDGKITYNNSNIYSSSVLEGQITLVTCSKREYIYNILKHIVFILIVAYIIIAFLSIFIATRFIGYFTSGLEKLNNRVECYLNTNSDRQEGHI